MIIPAIQPSIVIEPTPRHILEGRLWKVTRKSKKPKRRLSDGESLLERELRWLREGTPSPDGFKRIVDSRRLFEYTARKYGGNVEDVARAEYRQNRRCGICERPFAQLRAIQYHVDHCHESTRIRGILCDACNILTGRIEANDLDPETLLANLKKWIDK